MFGFLRSIDFSHVPTVFPATWAIDVRFIAFVKKSG